MEWFYADESEQQHRFEESEFETLVEDGKIKPDTLVWNQDMPDWAECASVRPYLFRHRATSPEGETASPSDSPPVDDFSALGADPSAIVAPHASGESPPEAPVSVQPQDPLAIASLICGICAMVFGLCLGCFAFPIALAAIICGHMSRNRLKQQTGSTEGGTMAMIGLILGYAGIVIGILMIILSVFLNFVPLMMDPSSFN